jgi:hypothetical protein
VLPVAIAERIATPKRALHFRLVIVAPESAGEVEADAARHVHIAKIALNPVSLVASLQRAV